MLNRNDKVIAAAVKEGIGISRVKGDAYAFLSLKKSKVPYEIIKRIIFEPQKIRSTD